MANEWVRKSYEGAAVATTLNGGISSSTLSITITSGSTWPDGSAGPFVASIDRAGSEEKVLVESRSGNVLTIRTACRGYDGTTNVGHDSGVTIEHVLDANTIDQVNAHAAAAATRGSISVRGAGDTFTELPVSATVGLPIISDGTDPEYGLLPNSALASEAFSTWTPVVIQGVTPTLTVTRGKFFQSSRRVTGDCHLTVTSSGTANNAITVSPPVTPATATVGTIMGHGVLTIGVDYTFYLVYASATTMKLLPTSDVSGGTADNYFGASGGATYQLTNGKTIVCFIDYEAAS